MHPPQPPGPAANDAGLSGDPQSRALLHAFVEWAVKDVALASLLGARLSGSFQHNRQTAKSSDRGTCLLFPKKQKWMI